MSQVAGLCQWPIIDEKGGREKGMERSQLFILLKKMKITGFRLVTGEKTISSSQVVHVVFLFFYSAFRVGGKMLRRCGQQVKAGHWVSLAVTG